MNRFHGFWSYVHRDDDADHGRISRLAQDVAAEYEMMTGDSIELFLDKNALDWGDSWREKIDESLASVAFFIPVMTPRYFMSAECRRELQFFARRADDLGIKELVLPLHYVDVPDLRNDSAPDDLMRIVRGFQWEDWRDLRFSDVATESYRRGVTSLASRLVEANRHAEQSDVDGSSIRLGESSSQDSGDDAPGFVDSLASAEEAIPAWTETISAIGREVISIGALINSATDDISKTPIQRRTFAHRLAIAKRLATQLNDPTDRVSTLGNDYASQLHSVDSGICAIIEMAPDAIKDNPETKKELCAFFAVVRDLSDSARQALDSAQSMVKALTPTEKMSRDLRPVLRKLRQALTVLIEGREITDEWIHLIDKSGLSC